MLELTSNSEPLPSKLDEDGDRSDRATCHAIRNGSVSSDLRRLSTKVLYILLALLS